MTRIIVLFFLLFCSLSNAQDIVIRSLKAYTGSESALPVYTGKDGLTIDFDIESEFMPNLNIVFRYCNRYWEPTNNIFLQNQGQNIYYNLDVVRLPQNVEEAKYHFRERFPDNSGFISFPHSGKWQFYITDSQDTSVVYASGRFFVVYPEIKMEVSVKEALLEDKTYYPLELGRVFDITTKFDLPEEMYPAYVTETEIIQNQNTDLPYIITRNFNTNTRQFYWNGDRNFSFTARDIRPGNEYRQVDLRNHNVYIGKDVRAHIEGIEISRFYRPGYRDLNGGSILTHFKNDYASYLNVKFELRAPTEVTGDIYLTGAFNEWQLLPEYKMQNSSGLYSITTLLKRGIYDYQYVVADIENDEIISEDWIILEGNFYETRNDYYIFVYYNEPNYGGYDRIIGYYKIQGR